LALAAGIAPGGAAPAGAVVAWHVWYASAAVCLAATALEFVACGAWASVRLAPASATASGVLLRLAPEDRLGLIRQRPRIALLMPAHNEASTEEDRESLADRIHDTLLRTPSYATFFLLADSPPPQRDNELAVIRRVTHRLRAAGRGYYADRLVLEEYRGKPLPWRHKCGSLLMWLERYGDRYEYLFVLDADSSLPEPDPRCPETCDPLERMVVAMRRDPGLALVQASIRVGSYRSLWGWIQRINARIGSDYYFPAFACVYGRASPCYGHNCLFRVSDFAAHLKNTLSYTSHDHVDAADLAAAGRGCVLTDAVVTCEEPEDTLPGWLKRECRWSRGNGQWLVYLLRKRSLPAAVAVYLGLGIMQYVWALLSFLLLVSAAVLVHEGVPMVSRPDGLPSHLLIGVVVLTLLLPKLLATRTLTQFVFSVVSSVLLGPTLCLFQGVSFVMGAFGSKWVPRGARATGFDLGQATRISATFFPAMILGLCLWGLVRDDVMSGPSGGGLLIVVTAAGMILSPLSGLLLSLPIPRRGDEPPWPTARLASGIS
jgi:hypothetical protein